jgi:putative RNA 2'-phosphotransferase
MSLVLRHQPDKAGITLDKNGWADVSQLIRGMNNARRTHVTLEIIKEVVADNDKQRFTFNEDYTKIRANQGHSISVDVQMKEANPPAVLYHGTVSKYIQAIKAEGLKPQSRLYVHLSGDRETAIKVGSRRGSPVILTIDAAKMHADGYKFYLSENGVWQITAVPAEYISLGADSFSS